MKTKPTIMTGKKLLPVLLMAFALPVFAQREDLRLIPYRKGDLWGYAAADKSILIKPEYSEANLFYAGFASVKKGDKYGYINRDGKVVIPFKFYVAKPFRVGYFPKGGKILTADDLEDDQKKILFAGASLRKDGYEICINTKGETMPKCPAIPENSAPEINKPSTVTIESNYSTIQKSDLFDKITGDYKLLAGADETYYIATRNNNYGVFNNKFEVIVPFEYSAIEKIKIGAMNYLVAEKNGLKGVFFGNGSPYITVENNKVQHIAAKNAENYFIISRDGKTGIKDMKYNYVVEMKYAGIMYDSTGGFIVTNDNNLTGFWFLNNFMLEPKYSMVNVLPGGEYVKVKLPNGKWGYVNSSGIEFFEE